MASRDRLLGVLAWWWGETDLLGERGGETGSPTSEETPRRATILAPALLSVLAFAAAAAVALSITADVRDVKPPTPLGRGTAGSTPGSLAVRFGIPYATRRQIFTAIAGGEPSAREQAEKNFPGQPWSVQDDRSADERDRVRSIAGANKINVTQAYLILDEGIRAHWPGPKGQPLDPSVVPLQPRRR